MNQVRNVASRDVHTPPCCFHRKADRPGSANTRSIHDNLPTHRRARSDPELRIYPGQRHRDPVRSRVKLKPTSRRVARFVNGEIARARSNRQTRKEHGILALLFFFFFELRLTSATSRGRATGRDFGTWSLRALSRRTHLPGISRCADTLELI